jgi:hypothetical protein
MRSNFVLPLPRFIWHPLITASLAAVHLYLSYGHLNKLFGGDAQWTDFWKGFGALFGAYVFAALALRQTAKPAVRAIQKGNDPAATGPVALPVAAKPSE